METDRPLPAPLVIAPILHATIDAVLGLPYADRIIVGSRLLTVIALSARALIELEGPQVNHLQIAEYVRATRDALDHVGVALRVHDQPSTPAPP